METVPKEILDHIFSYDRTRVENFNHVIHQINFIPCLGHIKYWYGLCKKEGTGFTERYFMIYKRMIHIWRSWRRDPLYLQSIRQSRWVLYWSIKRKKNHPLNKNAKTIDFR
jgi:hypothetical protein